MQFGNIPITQAVGGILAHSRRLNGRRLRKGHILEQADIDALKKTGVTEIMVARLEADDIPENEAARRIATPCAGPGAAVHAPFTGRVNLYAEEAGLVLVDSARIDALNRIHEAITVATLAPFAPVEARQMLATVKIIPFAAPQKAIEAAERILAGGPVVSVKPFVPRRAALISTYLSDTKPSLLDKNLAALSARLKTLNSEIVFERRTAHAIAPLDAAIREAARAGADPILIFGASAITDRRDVIPAAIEAAGGTIAHFGMPVDPGNLLLLGRLGRANVIGLPGCARSPKQNGIDFVLWRLAAGLEVGAGDIAAMGVGGLLTEIAARPQPRDEPPVELPRAPRIAAVVLAAGRSSRMGRNKLLTLLDGKPLVRHAVDAALASAASPIIVVTGKDAPQIQKALAGTDIVIANNPDYSNGLSTSLKRGINFVPTDCDGAVVILGDMPSVTAEIVNTLIAGFNPTEGRAICVATHGGKRGNPVLWARRFFPEILTLEGDVGAKAILAANDELVCDVEVANDAPLVDIDTEDDLTAYLAHRK